MSTFRLLAPPVFLTLLLGIVNAEGLSPWQSRPQPWRRLDAPVLSAYTTEQSWCKVVLYGPHVTFHDGKFRMWYLGTSTGSRTSDIAMGYAESSDGLRWHEHPENPILTGDDVPWGRLLQTPFVLFDLDEQIYKLWFVSGDGVRRDAEGNVVSNDQRLGYATSQDGIAWIVHPEPILPSGRGPSVLKHGPERYRMWMGSRPDPHGPADEIYKNIYEFTSTDGISWERAENPCIRPGGNVHSTVYPFVLEEDGLFHMWYGCHGRGKFEIHHAISDDGSKWAVDHDKPAFPVRSEESSFDSRYTSTPCVVSLPDRYLLYYSARDMKTTYLDKEGREQRDASGIYAHIGVAVLERRPPNLDDKDSVGSP